jgi:chromosome partitioning related protein ParA
VDIVGIVGTKGGVGKTTLAANLGGLLADLITNLPTAVWGSRPRGVLLVDNDTQASLSKYYDLAHAPRAGLSRLIQTGRVSDDCITPTTLPNLHIIINDAPRRQISPDANNKDLETFLTDNFGAYGAIQSYHRMLRSPYLRERYSYVLIDTPGALGPLLFTAALGADRMVTPVPPETTSAREFIVGTKSLYERLQVADEMLGITPGPMVAVINRATRTTDARVVKEMLRETLGRVSGLTLCDTEIPDAVAYKEAATDRCPVHTFAMHTRARAAISPYETMHQLLWELYPEHFGWLSQGVHADEVQQQAAGATG